MRQSLPEKVPPQARSRSRSPVSISPALRDYFEQHLNGGYKVVIRNKTKHITFLRNLLAKVVYEPGGGSVEDILVIYDLYSRVREKAEADVDFNEKYGEWLITVHQVLTEWRPSVFPFILKNAVGYEVRLQPFLPSRQAYYGWKNNPVGGGHARVVLNSSLAPPRRLRPGNRIGVGYRDKGTRRNLARDGSPHWKDVARSSTLELSPEEKRDREASRIMREEGPGLRRIMKLVALSNKKF